MRCEDCKKTEREVGHIALYVDFDGEETMLCRKCCSAREEQEQEDELMFEGREF